MMILRSLPLPISSEKPSGSLVMCRSKLRLILLPIRNALTWEHINAPKLIKSAAAENTTAMMPLCTMEVALEKSGATSSTSLMIKKIYTSGKSAVSALRKDNIQERYVSIL